MAHRLASRDGRRARIGGPAAARLERARRAVARGNAGSSPQGPSGRAEGHGPRARSATRRARHDAPPHRGRIRRPRLPEHWGRRAQTARHRARSALGFPQPGSGRWRGPRGRATGTDLRGRFVAPLRSSAMRRSTSRVSRATCSRSTTRRSSDGRTITGRRSSRLKQRTFNPTTPKKWKTLDDRLSATASVDDLSAIQSQS